MCFKLEVINVCGIGKALFWLHVTTRSPFDIAIQEEDPDIKDIKGELSDRDEPDFTFSVICIEADTSLDITLTQGFPKLFLSLWNPFKQYCGSKTVPVGVTLVKHLLCPIDNLCAPNLDLLLVEPTSL